MKYTYEMSREIKRLLGGDVDAFQNFFMMTANETYFHLKMVIPGEDEIERMMVKVYKSLYFRIGRLERPEDTVNWYNETLYALITDWINVNCKKQLIDEENGKYANRYHLREYLYFEPEAVLTEAETAKIAGAYLTQLNPVHALTGLAYFYDSLSEAAMDELLQVDANVIRERVKYILNLIEDDCKAYSKENRIEIQDIDIHLILLAYVLIYKDTYLPNPVEVYNRVVDEVN